MQNPSFPRLLSFVSALSLFALAGCSAADSAETEDEVAVDTDEAAATAQSNYGYFVVTRHDMRRCISPVCGGFFVKRVNDATTRCADGSYQSECYVSSIQLGGVGLSTREEEELRVAVESGKALVKARTYRTRWNSMVIGTLKATEGWVGATGSKADGSFYRVANNGIVCIKAPCPSLSAYDLNGNESHNLIEAVLDRTATKADQVSLDQASQALGTREGILVAGGIILPKCLPTATDCGPKVIATEFYLRVTRREGRSCGGRGMSFCNVGQFCSWRAADICGMADAPGQCAYKPEICTQIYNPVCGCDGKTYSNDCHAAGAGTSVASRGACK